MSTGLMHGGLLHHRARANRMCDIQMIKSVRVVF